MDFPFPPGAAGAARSAMPARPAAPAPAGPPNAGAADRFVDPATGQVNVPALLAAYEDLARRLATMIAIPGPDADDQTMVRFRRALGIPDTPDAYRITVRHPRLAVDPEVNRRLHAAGFTPSQAQLVYDLAVERVMPVIEAMGAGHRAENDLAALVEHFGGEERWAEISRQLSAWGKANLPRDVYLALASTREGVMALFRMMGDGEPGLAAGGAAPAGGAPGEEDLKALMRDPRYWKHRDPTVVRRVAEGFRRLYPTGG
ncbi:hypothetical protein [uncultured Rhodospira sp.]|uniref:capsid assembly protein n=1 Tax=uncultured Rhodospira sp. TaxID=1936189 RepID=UPI00261956D3|nr:hypothetical protein [uncultured Rhodospira sp.]